jgi:hypothetical protein
MCDFDRQFKSFYVKSGMKLAPWNQFVRTNQDGTVSLIRPWVDASGKFI